MHPWNQRSRRVWATSFKNQIWHKYQGPGSHPVEVNSGLRGPFQKKTNHLSQSAQRAGRSLPTQWTLHFVHKCRNETHLRFNIFLSYFQQAENHRFCDAGVGYSSSFPYSTRSSQFLSFLSLNSSYCNSPTFIPLYVSISALPSRRYGSVMAPNRYGLASFPIFHWRKGYGYPFISIYLIWNY